MPSGLVEAWTKNNAVNLMLLDAIPAKAFADAYSPRTRTVAAQFAHIHNVRIYQMQHRGREYLGELVAYPRGAQPKKREVRAALKASEKAIAAWLDDAAETGKVKSWPNSPTSFLGYFLAHEAHHRGLIMVCLRHSGTKLPKEITYGLWERWRKKG